MRKSLALVVLLAGVAAPGAHATVCPPGSTHYYGIVNYPTSASYTGGIAYLKTTRLSSYYSSDFITNEMWVATSNRSPCQSWVESGLYNGQLQDSVSHIYYYGTMYFWAEWNRADQFAIHYAGDYFLGSNPVAFKISYSGSNSWGVYIGGSQVGGTSHDHDPYAWNLETGMESVDRYSQETGTNTSLQKRGSDNSTWSYGWPSNWIVNDPGSNALWTPGGYPTNFQTSFN